MIAYHGMSEPCIAAQHQPALVLDYIRRRDAGLPARLLGKDLDRKISPEDYLALLGHTARALVSPDTSFMLGQQMLPGHFGAISHALLNAHSLRHALGLVCDWYLLLCPLLRPQLREEGQLAVLYWTDQYGAPGQLPFLVEMHMTAVTAMCRWLGDARLPWYYCFNRGSPRHVELAWLDHPWPRGNTTAAGVALAELRRDAAADRLAPSLPGALYQYLLANIRRAPTLETTAAAFGVSLATFKRHLARHHTHFQAELDQVRTHVALHLFHTLGYDNDAVARYLGFHDANNFRRSFKRWTGLTPSLLRDHLSAGVMAFNQ